MRIRSAGYMRSLLWSLLVVAVAVSAAAAGTARASLYALPPNGSAVIGRDSNVLTVYEDTLPDIAHRYSLG